MLLQWTSPIPILLQRSVPTIGIALAAVYQSITGFIDSRAALLRQLLEITRPPQFRRPPATCAGACPQCLHRPTFFN